VNGIEYARRAIIHRVMLDITDTDVVKELWSVKVRLMGNSGIS